MLVGVIVKSSYNLPEPSLEALLCTLRHSGNLEQRLVQLRMELAGSVPYFQRLTSRAASENNLTDGLNQI